MEEKYRLKLLQNVSLFQSMNQEEISSLLACLGAKEKKYKKEESIFLEGDVVCQIGIVLKGRVCIARNDYEGNRHIMTEVGVGELFAEAFACLSGMKLPFHVSALEESAILFLDYHRVIATCPSSCTFHGRLIENMVTILATKNIKLTRKMEHITQKTTREKLLSYLTEQAQLKGWDEFEILFDRQQLADYLGVDRSAMSHELGKMKKDGILDFNKNRFRLMKDAGLHHSQD